jgi:hypothetical protein
VCIALFMSKMLTVMNPLENVSRAKSTSRTRRFDRETQFFHIFLPPSFHFAVPFIMNNNNLFVWKKMYTNFFNTQLSNVWNIWMYMLQLKKYFFANNNENILWRIIAQREQFLLNEIFFISFRTFFFGRFHNIVWMTLNLQIFSHSSY